MGFFWLVSFKYKNAHSSGIPYAGNDYLIFLEVFVSHLMLHYVDNCCKFLTCPALLRAECCAACQTENNCVYSGVTGMVLRVFLADWKWQCIFAGHQEWHSGRQRFEVSADIQLPGNRKLFLLCFRKQRGMCNKHDTSISSSTEFPLASHPAMASMAVSEPTRVQAVIHTTMTGASLSRQTKQLCATMQYVLHSP